MVKFITSLLEKPFQKWGLDFIKPIKLASRYFSNQYILVVTNMPLSGWRWELCAPIQLLLQQNYYMTSFSPSLVILSQPHFGQVWGWSPTLPKLGIWSPPGLPNVQSSTERPKTPRIEVFLVSLERSWSVDIENGLALVIWTSVAQVMGKRRTGSQTGSLTPDH
jgi:hypothetical protein